MGRKKMNKRIFLFIMMLSLFSLVGCQDKTQTIMGSWKSVSPGPLGKIQTRIFEKDKVYIGEIKRAVSAHYKEIDENVNVYLENTTWIVTIIDEDTIMIDNPYVTKGKFIRTTPEEVKQINLLNDTPKSQSTPKNWKPF